MSNERWGLNAHFLSDVQVVVGSKTKKRTLRKVVKDSDDEDDLPTRLSTPRLHEEDTNTDKMPTDEETGTLHSHTLRIVSSALFRGRYKICSKHES